MDLYFWNVISLKVITAGNNTNPKEHCRGQKESKESKFVFLKLSTLG